MEKNCREKKFIEVLVVTLQNNLKDFIDIAAVHKQTENAQIDGIIQEILRTSPDSGKRMITVTLLSMGYNVKTYRIRQL